MAVCTAVLTCWDGNVRAQDGNVWVAPQVPGVDVSTLDQTEKSVDDCVYTYNIGADAFLTYGMNWNTNAIATRLTDGDTTADLPHATWVLKDGEAIKIVNNKNTNSALGGDPNTANNMWVDQNNQITYELVSGSTNEYYLSKDGVKIDVSWNYGGHLTGVNGKGFTKWAFIPKEKITDGSYALYKAKKEMYTVYSAIPESARDTYSEALNTAYSAYTASDATAQSVKDATKVLLGAVADAIETEVPANALFVHPDMLGEVGNITDWSTTARNASWSEFEVYHSAFTLAQTATVPNGLYKVVFHSLYRSDGSGAAPVLSVNEAYTASVPEMRTLNYGVDNSNGGNDWKNNNGWIPNGMQSCGQALAHDVAVAVINNIKVTDGSMTITVTENSTANWNNFQGFEIYYMGAINMALYKQLKEKIAVAEALKEEPMYAAVSEALNQQLAAAKLLTSNSDEAALDNAMDALDNVIARAQGSIASYRILDAGEIPSNTTDGWTCTNGNFQANTWSVEGNTDGSNMKTPFLQVWKGAGNKLDNATISYKLAGIEPGMYKVSVLARMLNEGGNADGISGASLYANEDKISIDNGKSCNNGIYSNYSIIGTVGEDETLTVGFELKDVTFNWISFKDVKVEKLDEVTAANMAELTGLVAEGAVYDATVKSIFKAMDVTPSETNYNNLSEYVRKVESSISYYEGVKVVLDDFQTKYAVLNATGETKVAYEALYNGLQQDYTNGNIVEFDTKVEGLNSALVAVAKAQTAENSDMTLAIVNPSFETGNLNDGWTLIGTPSSSVDNGVKPNSNNTYKTTGCDGDYLLNVWNTGLSLHQTIADMPNGVYQLTVACANTGATYKLMGKEVGTPEGNNAKQFVDQTCKFAVSNHQIDLLLETVDNVWYKVDNFRLTYLGELNYTALEDAVAGINYELGFAEGQYAPYNNIEAIKALAEAKALLANKDAFEQQTVDDCVIALASAIWNVNTEEVNAVYDGNFADQEEYDITGDNIPNVVLKGWTTNSGNTRKLIKNTGSYPGLNDATGNSAVFVHPGSYSYGKEESYAMPLQANTVYELSVKFAGWNGANNDFSVSVLNEANEGLAMTSLGKASAGINSANSLVTGKVRFVTGEAGNYILTVNADGNTVFTDIELLTAKAEDITVKVPAEYGTMILPFEAEIPAGMKVFGVENTTPNGVYNTLNLEPVLDKIEANTPYIVQKTDEVQSDEFVFNGVAYSDKDTYTSGLLTGAVKAVQAPTGSYVLQKLNNVLGFYKVVEGKSITVTAYHAYLAIAAASEVRAFVFDLNNDVTSVAAAVSGEDALTDVYSVDGVLVRKGVKASEALDGLQKGLYIVNGVKKAVR